MSDGTIGLVLLENINEKNADVENLKYINNKKHQIKVSPIKLKPERLLYVATEGYTARVLKLIQNIYFIYTVKGRKFLPLPPTLQFLKIIESQAIRTNLLKNTK